MTNRSIENNYPMDNKRIAYIFNDNTRKGSIKDVKDLETCLKKLSFEVMPILNNLDPDEIEVKLNEIEDADYSQVSCLIIVVMTYGQIKQFERTLNGYLIVEDANDITIHLDSDQSDKKDNDEKIKKIQVDGTLSGPIAGNYELIMNSKKIDLAKIIEKDFTKNKALNKLPKLFFIQACKKNIVKEYINTQNSSNLTTRKHYIGLPSRPNTLIMYSCSNAEYAFRDRETGSRFIQSLCKSFDRYGADEELLHLLSITINLVVADNIKDIKQLPQWVSTLQKTLYFKQI